MLLALLLSVFVLCLYGMKIRVDGFCEDYLSRPQTDAIKGIFILLIVLSHSLGYIRDSGYNFNAFGDQFFINFFSAAGQLVIVAFLFYSGYGVGESYKKKGIDYVRAFPYRRILTTLLNFDVAVIAFVVLSLCLGISISLKTGILSLIAWESVGNSNWYIFVILLSYAFSYIVLLITPCHQIRRVVMLFVFSVFAALILSLYKGNWWYDTILSYPMGFLYSSCKNRFEDILRRFYWLAGGFLLLVFLLFYFCPRIFPFCGYSLPHNIVSMAFAVLCVWLTMKVEITSPVLRWFGAHLFPVYIYMRIPMIFIEQRHSDLIATQPALFIVLSLVVTVAIVYLYRFWQIKLN